MKYSRNMISSTTSPLVALVLILCAALPASVLSAPPQDDPFYTFGSFRLSNGQRIVRTCAWLTESPLKKDDRLDRWCDERYQAHIQVKDKCQITCADYFLATRTCDKNFPLNWKDELGDGCEFYESGDNCNIWGKGYAGDAGLVAKEACARCGGGCSDLKVVRPGRDQSWFDSQNRSCGWYQQDASRCAEFGSLNRNFGLVANDACCACNGGTRCSGL